MTTTTSYGGTVNAASATSAASAASGVSATNTLTQLAGNFTDFLSLLTTQLKNQDPTSPMDTNQFTSQLVQFTSVAEQISTNKTLGQLLTSSLSQQLSQASNLVGQQVGFSGTTVPLQNGAAALSFNADVPQSMNLVVADAAGNVVHREAVSAAAGRNSWSWNGMSDSGRQMPDGAYTVALTQGATAVPYTASGIVTGAEQNNQVVQLQFGTASVPFGNVVSLTGAKAAG